MGMAWVGKTFLMVVTVESVLSIHPRGIQVPQSKGHYKKRYTTALCQNLALKYYLLLFWQRNIKINLSCVRVIPFLTCV